MSNLNPAPINQPVLEPTGLLTLQWILFLSALYDGDTGTTFIPIPVGMGVSGVATYTGAYYRSGQFIKFYIYIVPGTSTTSTAGTTYFTLPFDVKQDSVCFATGPVTAVQSIGTIASLDNRCYTPAWSAVTVPITIVGEALAA